MLRLNAHPTGHYRFLPGIAPYSCGVIADPGYEVVRVSLQVPEPWRDGFKRVDAATIRDDADKEVKAAAVAGLRERVKRYGADTTVLVQPFLTSSGHVQSEIVDSSRVWSTG